jgi:hypothetical protein
VEDSCKRNGVSAVIYRVSRDDTRPGAGIPRYPDRTGLLPGWYAIFVRELRERHRNYEYFRHFEPVATVGYTVCIYHISQVEAVQEKGTGVFSVRAADGHCLPPGWWSCAICLGSPRRSPSRRT